MIPDVALGFLVLHELDAVGDQTFPEPTDLVARIHLEPEVREPGTSLLASAGASASAKPTGSWRMTIPSGYRRAVAGSNRKNRA